MSDLTTKQCDVCGALKKEANHWWVMAYSVQSRMYTALPLENQPYKDSAMLDLCGIECLLKAENRVREGKPPKLRE